MAGLTAAQKKRRKKKNKKKEQRATGEDAPQVPVGASSRNRAREMTHEELVAESRRR